MYNVYICRLCNVHTPYKHDMLPVKQVKRYRDFITELDASLSVKILTYLSPVQILECSLVSAPFFQCSVK